MLAAQELPLVAWSYLEPDNILVVLTWGLPGERLESVEDRAKAVIRQMPDIPCPTHKKLYDRLVVASAMDLIHALNLKYRQDYHTGKKIPAGFEEMIKVIEVIEAVAAPAVPAVPATPTPCATCKDKAIQESAVYVCALCKGALCRRHAHHTPNRVFCWSCYIATMMYGKKEKGEEA